MPPFLRMSPMERALLGALGLVAVAAVAGVFWLAVGELSPAQQPPETALRATAPPAPRSPSPEPPKADAAAPVADVPSDPEETESPARHGRTAPSNRRLAGDGAKSKPVAGLGASGAVSGRVIDAKGAPVVDVGIQLLSRRGSFLGTFEDDKAIETTSAPGGLFKLSPVEPG